MQPASMKTSSFLLKPSDVTYAMSFSSSISTFAPIAFTASMHESVSEEMRGWRIVDVPFAADAISLGENSSSSVIKMCGDNIEFGVVSIDGEQHNYLYGEVLNIGVKKPNEMGAASAAGISMRDDTVDISGKLKYKENPIEDLLKWNLLKEVAGTAFGSATVSSLSLYREYLLTVGVWQNGNTVQMNRVLASTVIPMDVLIATKGYRDPNGMHQVWYSETYWGGLNCIDDTTLEIRSTNSGLARLWAR